MTVHDYLSLMMSEIAPAIGCTEPIAVAIAVAKARETLGLLPEKIDLHISRNILKNAMGVGIPGTGMVGLEIAAALSVCAGHSEYGLEVLSDATEKDYVVAREYAERGLISISTIDWNQKLYIEARVSAGDHEAVCVIEDSHTQITLIKLDGRILEKKASAICAPGSDQTHSMTVSDIYQFITSVDINKLMFLKEAIAMNEAVAHEGLASDYGMQVGRSLQRGRSMDEMSLSEYVCAFTAAAADARMSGCVLPVMSTAGSGNHGITASLPVVAAARKLGKGEEEMLRAEALSQLLTIHIKSFIGKLSPLCGCAIAASIGSGCAIVYLQGGGLKQIISVIQNMIADISGMVCDGAKAGCALKIASALASSMQCAQLALNSVSASALDGIVADDVEKSIRNLARLGNEGMENTDQTILNMMIANNKKNLQK